MESDLDNRNPIENAKISRNYGSTLVRDLRERYGENFAAGHADTATLGEVINRLDAASLNRLHGDLEKGQVDEVGVTRLLGLQRPARSQASYIDPHGVAPSLSRA